MRTVRLALTLVGLLAGLTHAQAQAQAVAAPLDSPPAADPATRWELDYETGILWRITGSATPLEYVIMPQLLSVKTPEIFQLHWAGGALVMRQRFSFLAEPIVKGAEHHYFGLTGSGLLEWWDHARTRSLFFSSGGGIGELDAHGYEIAGAQGQEFNLTWFIYAGAQLRFTNRLSASVGLYFQHLSNGHLDKVDPGLNALGPMLSAGWHF